MKIPLHPKLRGEWAEVHFLARASEHGLCVSKPYGDCRPYDFIVENNGRMFRVQVKSTSSKKPDCGGYSCCLGPTGSAGYRLHGMDFLAAYVIPEDVWYIIPSARLTAKRFINLNPRSGRNPYRQYREAWDLLLAESLGDVRRLRKNERLAMRERRNVQKSTRAKVS